MRTHPVDKLLEQHCYKSAAGLLQLVRFYVCTLFDDNLHFFRNETQFILSYTGVNSFIRETHVHYHQRVKFLRMFEIFVHCPTQLPRRISSKKFSKEALILLYMEGLFWSLRELPQTVGLKRSKEYLNKRKFFIGFVISH